jgi:putative nucleotidyltransferase with HDIG domain
MSALIKKTLFGVQITAKSVKRVLITALATFVVIGIIYSAKLPIRRSLNEGDIAVEDIYAPFSFQYRWGVDEEKTKAYQDQAEAKIPNIYSIDEKVLNDAEAEAEEFFSLLLSYSKLAALPAEEDKAANLEQLRQNLDAKVGKDGAGILFETGDVSKLESYTLETLRTIYSYPIISQKMRKSLRAADRGNIAVYNKLTRKKREESIADIDTVESILDKIKPLLSDYNIEDKKRVQILSRLISSWVEPNLAVNQDETDIAKREARSMVVPTYFIKGMEKGEIVVRKGQRIAREQIAQLDAVSSMTAAGKSFSQFWGIVTLICLLMFILYVYIKKFEYSIFIQGKLLLLMSLLIIFIAVSARLIVSSPLPSYFIPVAAVSMLITLLVGARVAAIVVIVAAVIVTLIAGIKFNIFIVSMVGGIFAICTIYKARSRSRIIRSGLYVGIFNFMTISAIGIILNFEPNIFLRQGLWGIASGIASAAIVMILLPVLEYLFKLTTDIKLLELADLNHPLLKDMVAKAPGTYHHSIIVGNLAETAANTIGANSLLCRISSYYHDIGKIEKAEYFAENKQELKDMHKGLSPSMSSLVITNHVKDGVELAEKYKLGNSIKDIIQQHHGGSVVMYFYHQAIEKKRQDEAISKEAFRYAGPKPQTKESAIVMLADSVEAASRVLKNPTPQHLKELVRKIVNNKFIDRQLDECALTLKDINRIAESFVRVLTGTYHSRVEYPDNKLKKYENNNNRHPKKGKA